MPRTVTLFRVFFSSPGDLAEERDICRDVVRKLNTLYEKQGRELRLEPVLFEDATYPAIVTTDPQAEISRQIGDYDIYVGILGQRFGTPTPRAGSGTEEEFNDACSRFKANPRSTQVLFYFKDVDPSMVKDPAQYSQVEAFRRTLQKRGDITYARYGSTALFGPTLFMHLALLVEDYGKTWGPNP